MPGVVVPNDPPHPGRQAAGPFEWRVKNRFTNMMTNITVKMLAGRGS